MDARRRNVHEKKGHHKQGDADMTTDKEAVMKRAMKAENEVWATEEAVKAAREAETRARMRAAAAMDKGKAEARGAWRTWVRAESKLEDKKKLSKEAVKRWVVIKLQDD